MSKGVGEVELGDYSVTSPPAVLNDRIIVGSAIGDNRGVNLEKGIVRALDARTGAVLWLWDPLFPDRQATPQRLPGAVTAIKTPVQRMPGRRCRQMPSAI